MKRKFKKLKKLTARKFYDNFVNDLKNTSPSKWYKMAKKIGAVNHSKDVELKVEALCGLGDNESAERIAQHFSAISQEYLPLDVAALPAFLRAPLPPRIDELEVFKRSQKMKKTESTQPIDLPHKLRKEFSPELSAPVSDILNTCLEQQVFPTLWKHEWVSPVPKVNNPKSLEDLRKISSTSEFSKLFV